MDQVPQRGFKASFRSQTVMQMLKRPANALFIFVLLGLLAGALIGYATIPVEKAAFRLGPIDIETQGKKPAVGDDLTNSQTQHVLTIVLIGGLFGLGCGFAMQRVTRT
jgi:hypothetical protein